MRRALCPGSDLGVALLMSVTLCCPHVATLGPRIISSAPPIRPVYSVSGCSFKEAYLKLKGVDEHPVFLKGL